MSTSSDKRWRERKTHAARGATSVLLGVRPPTRPGIFGPNPTGELPPAAWTIGVTMSMTTTGFFTPGVTPRPLGLAKPRRLVSWLTAALPRIYGTHFRFGRVR